jgi:hypothetical protein
MSSSGSLSQFSNPLVSSQPNQTFKIRELESDLSDRTNEVLKLRQENEALK